MNLNVQGPLESYFNYLVPKEGNILDVEVYGTVRDFFLEHKDSEFYTGDLHNRLELMDAYASFDKKRFKTDIKSMVMRLARVGILADVDAGKKTQNHRYKLKHFDADKTYERMVLDIICGRTVQEPFGDSQDVKIAANRLSWEYEEPAVSLENESDLLLQQILGDVPKEAPKMQTVHAGKAASKNKSGYSHLDGKVVADIGPDGTVRIGVYFEHKGNSRVKYLRDTDYTKELLIGDANHLELVAGADVTTKAINPMYVTKDELNFLLYCSGVRSSQMGHYTLNDSKFFSAR